MNIIKHAAVAVPAVAVVTAPAAGAATGASSLRYQCAGSTKTIDDAAYSGPRPDNGEVTVSVRAARSGARVYAYAEAWWDGPPFYAVDDPAIFDGAKLRLQIKRSREGSDPVVRERDFTAIEDRLEDSTSSGNHDGRYRTGTISHRAGPGALADAALFLGWQGDGRGYQRHEYTGSPTV